MQFVCAVLTDAGILPKCSFTGYDTSAGMWFESTKLQDTILKFANGVWVTSDFEFGDIFILKTGKRSAHCGLFTADGYIWHALGGRCVTKSDYVVWKNESVGMVRLVGDGFRLNPTGVRIE